ncbi:MAG TPA: hypothetical protein VMS31_12185 [Pyrinomonadaceae bacterium]|nr:hypothetical protein [Pyrinomonadaceae bacterium]
MEPKKSKYDTNPLDPDFVKKTEEFGDGDNGEPVTQDVRGGATREIGSSPNEKARGSVYSEAPTRRIDNLPLDSPYQSVFAPPSSSPPAPYQPSPAPYRPVTQQPTSRSVLGLGLPEKWAIMLPYAPFHIGIVPALIELFLVPKSEHRVRFHASQGLALHLAVLAVQTLFGLVGAITDSSIGGALFGVAAFVFLIISMVRVWKGEPHYIAPLNEPAKWLDEHIKPRNKS